MQVTSQKYKKNQDFEGHYVVTGLFGDSQDFGVYPAPELPGVSCLFFSNSDVIGRYAEAQGWRFIKTFHPMIADDRLETSLQSKWVKYLQFLDASPLMTGVLANPKSVLYFDHKFNVTSEHAAKILQRDSDCTLLIRTTPVEKDSIDVEIEAALPFERYSRHMDATRAFVDSHVSLGAKREVTICNTGLIHFRDLQGSKELADRVYNTCISLRQPECQIVWAVHSQAFAESIEVIPWEDPLVGDIEWQDPKVYTASDAAKITSRPKEPGHGIVIAGFHRSGTSSVAGLLHNSGISAGTDLMDKTEDNAKGYFESWALVNLHDRLMNSKGVDWATTLAQKAELTEADLSQLRHYFNRRAENAVGAWCMKDPRIGRYIFEWKRAAPELKFLVLYRSPNSSAHSLQRRSLRDFAQTRGTSELPKRFYDDPDHALRLWVEHNEAYVALCRAHPDECLVIGHTAIMEGFNALEAASKRFGIDIPLQAAPDFLDSSLLSRPKPLYVISSELRDRAIAVWKTLCEMDVSEPLVGAKMPNVEDLLILDEDGRLARAEHLELFAEVALTELEARHHAAKEAWWRANQALKGGKGKTVKAGTPNQASVNEFKAQNALLRFQQASEKRLAKKNRVSRDCARLRKSNLFDSNWYLERNPDVKAAGIDAIEHYIRSGAGEGRDPSANFSTIKYLTLYDDVTESGINPLLHYVEHGQNEGRSH